MQRTDGMSRLRESIGDSARAVAPGFMASRARRHARTVRAQKGVLADAEMVFSATGGIVQGGPLEGLRYPDEMVPDLDAPAAMLLGAYEEEIQDGLEEALSKNPPLCVDIGAGVGHYAVGLARRVSSVVAFEDSSRAQASCERLAAFNDVAERVEIRGHADAEALDGLDLANALVLSDCEGGEAIVFTEETIGMLDTATVVIELHESLTPGITDLLRKRFAPTHEAEILCQRPRDPRRYPGLRHLPESRHDLALSDLRDHRDMWGIFRPVNCREPT